MAEKLQDVYGAFDKATGALLGLRQNSGLAVLPLASLIVTGLVAVASGAYDATAGAINSARLQALLDAGGDIRNVLPGVYPLASRLKVKRSDTSLQSADGVEYIAAPGIGTMLDTDIIDAAGTVVTLTSVSTQSLQCTVNWVGHAMTTRDCVYLKGPAEYYLNGIFQVLSITNADSFVIQLRTLPGPTNNVTGVVTAKKALQNIIIDGGIWNYNAAGGNDSTGGVDWQRHAIRLGGINNLKVRNVQGKDTKKFVLCVGAVRKFNIGAMPGRQLGSDNVKVYGPAWDGVVTDVGGYTSDDQLSLQTNEPPAYASYRWTYGDVLNVTVERTAGITGVGGLAVYPNEGGRIDGIRIMDFGNQLTSASSSGNLTIDYQPTAGALGTITIDSPFFTGQKNCIVIQAAGGPGGNWEHIVINNPAQRSFNNAGRFISIGAGNFNGHITINGGKLDGGEGILNNSSTGDVTLNLNDVRGGTLFYPFRINGVGGTTRINGSLTLDGTPTNSFLSVPAGSSPIIYLGLHTLRTPATPVFSIGGTPTIYPTKPGCKVDLAVCTRIDGVIAYNTNATLGTLAAAGLVVGQGTAANSWKLLADPTKAY